ncbi:MAG TPA: SCP2 sterol-binding domain-containing protein, partial [Roseiflexaceae bacterium]|nr:SCP2 sterol-binding domain-containing protein [Roseiflexaceae bacterium]
KVGLELDRDDGSTYETTITFADQEEPAVVISMTTDDYAAMMSGELNGNMAFMTGKLRFEGSLPLLLKLGALSG